MNSWKSLVNLYSINPVQKFSYTTGKNSTDSSMIIDAMDILHSKNIDGFCIVSSDSDYTGLAKRIREEGVFVMGIGEKKTPEAFVKSCEIFTYTENLVVELSPKPEQIEATTSEAKPVKRPEVKKQLKEVEEKKGAILSEKDYETIDKAFQISINEEDEAYISKVGANIRKIDPSFDSRTYGFYSLTKLFESLDKYEVVKNIVGGLNHPLVKLK